METHEWNIYNLSAHTLRIQEKNIHHYHHTLHSRTY